MEKIYFSKRVLLPLSLISLLTALSVTGCAATRIPLNPNAQKIKILENANNFTLTSQGCRLAGQVVSKTITPYKTTNITITSNEMNAVKNQALTLGADTLAFTENKLVYDHNQTTHLVIAAAYVCEPSVINMNMNINNN